jgi:Leucine-rich repeat (LRR) protein
VKYGIFPQFVRTLDISYNHLDIHHKFKIFALLNNLETLLLHGNKIENFDPVIFESGLKFIGISDNPFSCSTLADFVMLMNSKNIIHVYESKVKNTSNIQGIKCTE